ncbi:DNA cytosine methyltransferase [Mediterraneibacter gnavus]|uniref:DNA cytosine methyltransferase n=1 Tax=Mediterraneibacter gnavus TaxID=33038 RepID=UPI002AC34F97|nr:DNA cytosine methyltransferase [Mediterraneibacter gnavus]
MVPKKILPVTGTDGENSVSIIDHRDEYRRNTQTFSPGGITETLDTGQGGGREHHVGIPCFCDMNYKAGLKTTDSARTIQARYNKGVCNRSGEASGVVIPVLTPVRAEKRQNGRRFKENGDPMFTLTSQDRHGIAINVKEATKQGYDVAHEGDSINLSIPDSKTRRGRVGKQLANTLDTSCNQGIFVKVENELTVYAIWYEKYQCYIAIRKLTPKECFRLQGWTDDYFEKAKFVNSDSQLYKQAGNGVTVNVVRAIGDKMTIRRND